MNAKNFYSSKETIRRRFATHHKKICHTHNEDLESRMFLGSYVSIRKKKDKSPGKKKKEPRHGHFTEDETRDTNILGTKSITSSTIGEILTEPELRRHFLLTRRAR